MGTHGRKGISRLLAGSVATAVIRGAKCPVLAQRSRVNPGGASTFGVILHPTDFSECSRARWTWPGRSPAIAVRGSSSSTSLRSTSTWRGGWAWSSTCREYRMLSRSIRERVDGPDLNYPVETQLTRGFEAEDILQVAKEAGCDLIVMGTHGRSGLGRVLMGSTAESVVPRADCPVLVVKASPRGARLPCLSQ